jgi:small subunit ribosomal protein S20
LANHKSAAKRARQTIKRQAVNGGRKSAVRTVEKGLLKALAAKDTSVLPDLLKKFMSQMSKAAQKGAFKKETASRRIGRISARVAQLISGK